MSRLAQELHVVNVGSSSFIAANEDFLDGTVDTDVVNLGKYEKAMWIIQKGAGATGTTVVTVDSCLDVTPTASTAIAFNYWVCTTGDTYGDMQTATATGFTTTAGANQVYKVEVNAAELSDTHKYARLVCTEATNDPCDGSIVCVLGAGRHVHEVPATAIV